MWNHIGAHNFITNSAKITKYWKGVWLRMHSPRSLLAVVNHLDWDNFARLQSSIFKEHWPSESAWKMSSKYILSVLNSQEFLSGRHEQNLLDSRIDCCSHLSKNFLIAGSWPCSLSIKFQKQMKQLQFLCVKLAYQPLQGRLCLKKSYSTILFSSDYN